LYSNDGNGNFTESSIEVSSWAWGITARDFDQDGDIDIFCGSGGDKSAIILHSNGDGTFQDEQVVATEIGQIIDLWVTDMDGDNVQDVLTASSLYDGYLLFINEYDGPLSSENLGDALKVQVYPNPTTDRISITAKSPLISSIEIIDITGNTLIVKNIDNSQSENLSLKELNSGYYAIVIKDSKGNILSKHKIIKQ
jgi:hypothetical protein